MIRMDLTEIMKRVEEAKHYGHGVGKLALDDVPKLVEEVEELREGTTKYITELETEVFRLQDELNGDGVLTLVEQVEHTRAEIRRQNDLIDELYSISLWGARRMLTRQYSAFMYDEIEKVMGEEVDRDWRGEQV